MAVDVVRNATTPRTDTKITSRIVRRVVDPEKRENEEPLL